MTRSGVIAVGAGDRTLTFFALNSKEPVSKITMSDGMPLCLAYYTISNQDKEILLVGDDLGILHALIMKGKWHMCDLQTLKDMCMSCHLTEKEAIRDKFLKDGSGNRGQSNPDRP